MDLEARAMKRLVSLAQFATGLVAVSGVALAQDCSDFNMSQLAGTYTMSGSAISICRTHCPLWRWLQASSLFSG
jgi:hypothetical protein